MSNSLIDVLNLQGTITDNVSLNAKLGNNEVQGTISNQDKLIGTIESNLSVVGSISSRDNLIALIEGNTISYPSYDGDYIVIPKAREEQTLETKNKVTRDNITVKEIPYHETLNEYGYTITIG